MKRSELIELARRVVFPNKYNTSVDGILKTVGIQTFGSTEKARKFLFQGTYWNS